MRTRLSTLSLLMICLVAARQARPQPRRSMLEETAVENAYREYVRAWKTKDLAALRRIIADDYMAVNVLGVVSSKENEIGTAALDPRWDLMTVEEIHTNVFGAAAIASGFISARGETSQGEHIAARVRFLAALAKRNGKWQLMATQSASTRDEHASGRAGVLHTPRLPVTTVRDVDRPLLAH